MCWTFAHLVGGQAQQTSCSEYVSLIILRWRLMAVGLDLPLYVCSSLTHMHSEPEGRRRRHCYGSFPLPMGTRSIARFSFAKVPTSSLPCALFIHVCIVEVCFHRFWHRQLEKGQTTCRRGDERTLDTLRCFVYSVPYWGMAASYLHIWVDVCADCHADTSIGRNV